MTDAQEQRSSVVGAGIAGMAAAMHLAELGHPVHLLEAAPAIGGSMHLLDHTFPDQLVRPVPDAAPPAGLLPDLRVRAAAREVNLLPYAELDGAGRESQAPSGPRCATRHGTWTWSGATAAAIARRSAPRRGPTTTRGGWRRSRRSTGRRGCGRCPTRGSSTWTICTRCGACVDACPEGAIDLGMQSREEEVEVGGGAADAGLCAL